MIAESSEGPLVWLHDRVKSPPFSSSARVEAGVLLGRLQQGERLAMPHSRPMPVIGARCHELRIPDGPVDWRIMYRLDADAIVILAIVKKKSQRTPYSIIETCQQRLRWYDEASRE